MSWYLIPVLLMAGLAAFAIVLNLRYHRARAKLTSEERVAEDEQLKNEGIIY